MCSGVGWSSLCQDSDSVLVGVFADAAAPLHAGLHLQIGLILGRAPHFFERAVRVHAEAVARVGEPDALIGLRLQMLVERLVGGLVVQVVETGATKRAAVGLDADDHDRSSLSHSAMMTLASSLTSCGGGSWWRLQ